MGFAPEEGEDGESAESEGRKDAKEDGVHIRQLSTSTGNGARGYPPRGPSPSRHPGEDLPRVE